MHTVAVIGDVGGHLDQLASCLARLGVTGDTWPDGLHVIQVGDLLGGNDDIDVAHLVQPHLYSGRWTQLVGNWELSAVGGPEITNRHGKSADPEALTMFARWCGAGLVRYATTVTSSTGRTAVVTHAGICRSWLHRNISGVNLATATDVATAINHSPSSVLHYGGEMIDRVAGKEPSPVWASTPELWRSWEQHPTPWPQIHGHTTARHWTRHQWAPWTPVELTIHATPDDTHHRVRYQPDGHPHPIWGIDPGLWERSTPGTLHALTLTAATTP